MNTPAYIVTDNSITVVVKGKPYTTNVGQANFNEVKQRIIDGKFENIERLFDTGAAVASFTKGNVVVKNNAVYYKGQPVHNYVVDRILAFMRDGLPHQPLVNFLDKLMQNPSFRAVQELYGFLEATNLPITEDGDFLAFRKITTDYKDFYTGTFDNSIGAVVTMPRNAVNENKDQTCSQGLHFCSHSYLPHYHGGQGRVVIVKINPADVVAIPSDYNNAKGRCCRYVVYADCAGHDAGTNFASPYFPTSETKQDQDVDAYEVEVVIEDEEFKDDSYEEGYLLGRADGNSNQPRWPDSHLVMLGNSVDHECFSEGYHDGYDAGLSTQESLSTREKLSKIAIAAKRDASGRFTK